jgi:hypothetical protein
MSINVGQLHADAIFWADALCGMSFGVDVNLTKKQASPQPNNGGAVAERPSPTRLHAALGGNIPQKGK